MKRHLIIEGMDGSGKDTLINQLLSGPFSRYRLHERASTTLGGPVKKLDEWVDYDLAYLNESPDRWIYNRHPLISEPIYGPHRLDRPTHPAFAGSEWLPRARADMGARSVVVICQPPYSVLSATLKAQGAAAHMSGVFDNALALYTSYKTLVWPGAVIRYDYTANTVNDLAETIRRVMFPNG